jgi:GntR family transcriptional regulator/MocR family aminotransferase
MDRASRRAGRAIPLVHLNSASAIPLYQQLYLGLRHSIVDGQLAGGTRLASTRTLAAEWGVSRFTVVNAMERLLAEGYLRARQGSGTFVVDTLPETTMVATRGPAPAATKRVDRGAASQLSSRGLALSAVVITGPRAPGNDPRPFHPRRAPLDIFPLKLWRRIVRRQWAATDYRRLDYADPAGHPALREAIAAHISVTRAVRCTPQQVIITSGSQQAFDILFRLLLDPGDAAWIEEPGYLDVRAALVAAGARLIPVSVDASGIDVAEGIRLAPRASLAVVSPSHQYPTGVTLAATRRAALLDWARGAGAWIVEDDYDSYFRYSGRPMSALQGVDREASASHHPCVVYVGTFSKTVFPGLRLGFCVVPDSIVDAVINARAVAARNSPLVDQAALAEFIVNGHYDQHLRRIRIACQERYEALRSHCARHIPDLSLSTVTAGTHVLGRLRRPRSRSTPFSVALSRAAAEEDLVVFPLGRYCLRRATDDAIVLGFGGVSPRRLATGVERLARAFARVRRAST